MNYHIYFNGNKIASFEFMAHRDMVLKMFIEKYPYAESQITTMDIK